MELKTGTLQLIDDALEKAANQAKSRDYLGASLIGEECYRKIWYSFHTPKPITDPRVNRIFRLGNIIEEEVINLLRMAGLTVYTEMEDGEQFGFTDGKLAGHIDGVVGGLPESTKPHLLEIKSAKDKSWKEFRDKGYKKSATYWGQVQIYMLKMGLERALAVVYNKDTSELYIERIRLEKRQAEALISKGHAITEMTEPPPRKYAKSTYFKCKWCDHSDECWSNNE